MSVAKEALIEARDLKMYFPVGNTVFGKRKLLKAVDGVSFGLYPGETFGLVGESGCGKTTVGRALVRLYSRPAGRSFSGGADIAPLSEAEVLPYRNRMQMIFQVPLRVPQPAHDRVQHHRGAAEVPGREPVGDHGRVRSLIGQVGLKETI